MTAALSRAQARRVALAAQGFRDRAHARPTMRTLQRAVDRVGVLQVDSVNVLQRAHYMPLYSRMGPYDTDLLARASSRAPRRLVEYWAHVQALMPVELWPLMRHRMDAYRAERHRWRIFDDRPQLDADVLAAVRERGPVTARDLEEEFHQGPRSKEHWGWNWSDARKALDYLFLVGDVAIARRNGQFEVVYDVPERVLPADVLAAPAPTVGEAARVLVSRAARHHGVGTAACFADYYRMRLQPAPGKAAAQTAVAELVEAGELVPVQVEGWRRPAYLHRDAAVPRRLEACTVLSPFDPVCWERARTEALFDFRYRIEIYVPQAKRQYGYYVLPFLLGDRIVGRLDLKADRVSGVLVVRSAWGEAGVPDETPAAMAGEMWRLAGWLGLSDVRVEQRGDLAAALAVEVPRARP